MRVFIGNGAFKTLVTQMFIRQGYSILPSLEGKCDAVVLIGGGDINPKLYGEKPLKSTYFDDRTDVYDVKLYNFFIDKPKIGICRGGQLLNVLSGGGMWQHVNNHETNHDGFDADTGSRIKLSSIHHQMMIPNSDGLVITTARVSTHKLNENTMYDEFSYNRYPYDIEGVYYDSTNSLCFQPHPEIGPPECEEYFFSLIHKYLGI